MNKPVLFLAVAVCFLFLIDYGFAIKCYQCNSYFQQDCADYFRNQTHHLQDCGVNVTMCRKIVQEVYYSKTWNTRYIRQCAPHGVVGDDDGRECVERTGTYKVKMRYCHCNNQDGCNGASDLFHSSTLLLLSFLSMAVVYLTKRS